MRSKISTFTRAYILHRYRVLFYSLMLTFCASPLLAALNLNTNFLHFFLAINLVVALIGERKLRASRLITAILILIILTRAIATLFDLDYILYIVIPLLGVFTIATVALLLKSALNTKRITDETLYAALSGYLVGGLCMAFTYWSIEQVLPNSFVVADTLKDQPFTIATAVYFSFITLATLGYGDIVPNSELTRGLVSFQCVAGQFYLVVMVARLVSLYRSESGRSETESNEGC